MPSIKKNQRPMASIFDTAPFVVLAIITTATLVAIVAVVAIVREQPIRSQAGKDGIIIESAVDSRAAAEEP